MQEEKSSPKFARAFALGCGGQATSSEVLQPGPVALFMSPARRKLLDDAIADGRTWYYGDHGYYRRFTYYRVSKNAYQWQPTWEQINSAKADRFRSLNVATIPHWQTGGNAIVICPNSPTYMAWFGIDARQWVLDIVKRLSELTDRPIVVRWKSQSNARPLYVDLHTAYLTIVFSSAAAVESLIAGIPIVTLAPWATTASMGLTDLSQIAQPFCPPIEQRDQFLFTLANHQWTLDEIEKGAAWKVVAYE